MSDHDWEELVSMAKFHSCVEDELIAAIEGDPDGWDEFQKNNRLNSSDFSDFEKWAGSGGIWGK